VGFLFFRNLSRGLGEAIEDGEAYAIGSWHGTDDDFHIAAVQRTKPIVEIVR
jgi:hypothetical protein